MLTVLQQPRATACAECHGRVCVCGHHCLFVQVLHLPSVRQSHYQRTWHGTVTMSQSPRMVHVQARTMVTSVPRIATPGTGIAITSPCTVSSLLPCSCTCSRPGCRHPVSREHVWHLRSSPLCWDMGTLPCLPTRAQGLADACVTSVLGSAIGTQCCRFCTTCICSTAVHSRAVQRLQHVHRVTIL